MSAPVVFWDWNGTLLDDSEQAVGALNASLSRRGLKTIDVDFYRANFAFPARGFYRLCGMDLEGEDWDALAEEYHREYLARPARLAKDAVEALEEAKRRGWRQFVVSALRQDLLDAALAEHGIAGYFESVHGAGNLDGASKADTARALAERLRGEGVRRIAVIGDSFHDREVAEAIGAKCVFYGGGSHSPERLAKVAPVASTLREAVERCVARGFSLMSGGLDSQLAVRVLQAAGAEVEGLCFETPFFSSAAARKAAAALGVKLNVVDFTADEIALVENPPHGYGGAMNPCIDCHATMIRRAGEMMRERGFDFVATGEVMGQRPMSQNAQSLRTVERDSGLAGRLVRPLSAKLLEPTVPELDGSLDRDALLDIRGRCRERQITLAAELGISDYPSPAGGCKLTEAGYCLKLKDLMDHEGLSVRRLVELLSVGRRFRLPDGAGVILGRDSGENAVLARETALGAVVAPENCPGPTALVVSCAGPESLETAARLVVAWSKCDRLEGDVSVRVVSGGGAETRTIPVAPPVPRTGFVEWQIKG